jgi:hypothetical protein
VLELGADAEADRVVCFAAGPSSADGIAIRAAIRVLQALPNGMRF